MDARRQFIEWMENSKPPTKPNANNKVLEYIDISKMFPDRMDKDDKFLVAVQEVKDQVHLGISSKKDEVPDYYSCSFPADMFYSDPFGTMGSYLDILIDVVNAFNNINWK